MEHLLSNVRDGFVVTDERFSGVHFLVRRRPTAPLAFVSRLPGSRYLPENADHFPRTRTP